MEQLTSEQMEQAQRFCAAVQDAFAAIQELRDYAPPPPVVTGRLALVIEEAKIAIERGDLKTPHEVLDFVHYQMGLS